MDAPVKVAPCQTAASRTDLVDVEHRNANRKAGLISADEVIRSRARGALLDDASLGGGPPHVEADGVGNPELVAKYLGPGDTGRRSGFHHLDRQSSCGLEIIHTAVRLHDHQRALHPV